MIIIESTSETKVEDNVLIETESYIIDFESHSNDEIKNEIQDSTLDNYIDWQSGNRYGKLQIVNYIGNIIFFGQTYDVRSNKFLNDLSGVEQFSNLLEDVQRLSRNIIFSYKSPSFALGNVDFKAVNPSLMLIFNYFKKVILDWDYNHNLDSSLRKITHKPNTCYSYFYQEDRIEKVKKIDINIVKSIITKSQNWIKVEENSNLKLSPISKLLTSEKGDSYFPSKALVRKNKLVIDTPENKFVKYFLRFILSFAYRLNSVNNLPSEVHDDKDKILDFCRKHLSSPFFRNINELSIVPLNSTVLQSREGYKEVYAHYIRSRFGIKHIFEEFEKNSLSVGLKMISDLYEYWVFYKVAIAFLGNEIIIEQQEIIEEDDKIIYGVCFRNGNRSVFYNYTESKPRGSSYSIELRPDTTVVLKGNNKSVKLIFDAKYKVNKARNTETGVHRYFKTEDIHKMHTYMDAIKDVKMSIAVYPGTEFIFYERDENKPIRNDISSIEAFEGVGALPLIPENKEHEEQLNRFVSSILSSYE